MIIYIDSYKNVITNITREIFKDFGKDRKFTICFRNPDYNISLIHQNYHDVAVGERLALFTSGGFLEIAINNGTAASLLGLKLGEIIRIEFHDTKNDKNRKNDLST